MLSILQRCSDVLGIVVLSEKLATSASYFRRFRSKILLRLLVTAILHTSDKAHVVYLRRCGLGLGILFKIFPRWILFLQIQPDLYASWELSVLQRLDINRNNGWKSTPTGSWLLRCGGSSYLGVRGIISTLLGGISTTHVAWTFRRQRRDNHGYSTLSPHPDQARNMFHQTSIQPQTSFTLLPYPWKESYQNPSVSLSSRPHVSRKNDV